MNGKAKGIADQPCALADGEAAATAGTIAIACAEVRTVGQQRGATSNKRVERSGEGGSSDGAGIARRSQIRL